MPQGLPLLATPNQSFTTPLENQNYKLSFKATRGVMAISISINDIVLVSNSRFFADRPLIPYKYLEGKGGNFILTTEGDSLPAFAEFGTTQFLFYLTAAEVVALAEAANA